MDEIEIRAATPADREALDAMIAAAYATLDDGSYAPDAIRAALPAMSGANPRLLSSGTYFVAEIGGAPAGCGGWSFDEPGTGARVAGVAHIRHFATHPDHRRKGVAHALMSRCIDEARAAGATTLRASATLPARPFYEAHAFSLVGLVEKSIGGNPLPVAEMELSL